MLFQDTMVLPDRTQWSQALLPIATMLGALSLLLTIIAMGTDTWASFDNSKIPRSDQLTNSNQKTIRYRVNVLIYGGIFGGCVGAREVPFIVTDDFYELYRYLGHAAESYYNQRKSFRYYSYNCRVDEFRCKYKSSHWHKSMSFMHNPCISRHLVCNQKADCFFGDDEENCPIRNCSNGHVPCPGNPRICISPNQFCNGKNDCGHSEDENNCTVCHSSSSNAQLDRGTNGTIEKFNINEDSYHYYDDDYYDEIGKLGNYEEIGSKLRCGMECWGREDVQRCDGFTDCPDGSDELNCNYGNCSRRGAVELCNGVCLADGMTCEFPETLANMCKGKKPNPNLKHEMSCFWLESDENDYDLSNNCLYYKRDYSVIEEENFVNPSVYHHMMATISSLALGMAFVFLALVMCFIIFFCAPDTVRCRLIAAAGVLFVLATVCSLVANVTFSLLLDIDTSSEFGFGVHLKLNAWIRDILIYSSSFYMACFATGLNFLASVVLFISLGIRWYSLYILNAGAASRYELMEGPSMNGSTAGPTGDTVTNGNVH